MKNCTQILYVLIALVLCVCAPIYTCAHAQNAHLGTNISNATQVDAVVSASLVDGVENYFKIAATNLPATVYYIPDSAFGPIPELISVAGEDTLPAQFVSENCRMAWKWELAEAAEDEAMRYLYFSTHEDNAVTEIYPYLCAVTYSDTAAVACGEFEWRGETYSESGDYAITLTNAAGCDSIRTLSLTILQPTTGSETHSAYDSFAWHGESYTESGDYYFTTTNAVGCDSTVTLHLTIRHVAKDTIRTALCPSELPYAWQGMSLTQEDVYTTDTIMGVGSETDSLHSIELTILPTYAVDTVADLCGTEYEWRGATYTESGSYPYAAKTSAGCDSIVTLQLTLRKPTSSEESQDACISYTWHGETYTQSGDYSFATTNAAGCDSVVTLHLTIHEPYAITLSDTTVCESYTWGDTTINTSGTYTRSHQSIFGCDSIVTRKIWVTTTQYVTDMITAYDSCVWLDGNTYRKSTGGPIWYVITDAGCDSVVVSLMLTIRHLAQDTVRETICASELPYAWQGMSLTQEGVFSTDTIKGIGVDTDTVHTMELTVLPTYAVDSVVTLCGTEYEWRGTTYAQSGSYPFATQTVAGCDSVVTLHLTLNAPTSESETETAYNQFVWHDEEYTESGEYTYTTTNAAGCDSVMTLYLTIRHVLTDTTRVNWCSSELPYVWRDMSLTQDGVYTTDTIMGVGSETDTLYSIAFTVLPIYAVDTVVDLCGTEYEWRGTEYTQSGEYPFATQTIAGCDSIVTLHLTLRKPTFGSETVSSCESYLWHGETYTESGEYSFTTTNAAGCDSVVTLHLTVGQDCYTYDTVYFCPGFNSEHEEKVSDDKKRRYVPYVYEAPDAWVANIWEDGLVVETESERTLVDLHHAEQLLYAHYVDPLEPIYSIVWSFRPSGADSFSALTVGEEPQWIENGTISLQVQFLCGHRYRSNLTTDMETVVDGSSAGRKVLMGDQIIIIRNGIKYTLWGTKIQ